MKTILFVLACALVILTGPPAPAQSFRLGFSGAEKIKATLVIQTNGSSTFTYQSTQSRKMTEFQIAAWDRYLSDDAGESRPANGTNASALTDEQLVAKLRAVHEKQIEMEQTSGQIDSIEVLSNEVKVAVSQSFASLHDLMARGVWTWGPNQLYLEDARFEIDTNGHFHITFLPSAGAERYSRTLAQQWKSKGAGYEWRLTLPGKILTSSLPTTEERTTELSVDSARPETIDPVMKLVGKPLEIVSEPGGLSLEEPLKASQVVQQQYQKSTPIDPKLPVTDAGPGFLAEALGLSVSTMRLFPEASKFLTNRLERFESFRSAPAGTMVSVRLFPPKGRLLREVSGIKVHSARDDKGRSIAPGRKTEFGDAATYSINSGEDESDGAKVFQLPLALPASDAQAIEQVEAEVIAVTIGGWKDLSFPSLQENASREVALDELVPGARLNIKKVKATGGQTTIEATIEGPPAVLQLELKLVFEGPNSNSSMTERKKTEKEGKVTRSLTVTGYDFSGRSQMGSPSGTLKVRFPQDAKRERVTFKLTGLDLL